MIAKVGMSGRNGVDAPAQLRRRSALFGRRGNWLSTPYIKRPMSNRWRMTRRSRHLNRGMSDYSTSI